METMATYESERAKIFELFFKEACKIIQEKDVPQELIALYHSVANDLSETYNLFN